MASRSELNALLDSLQNVAINVRDGDERRDLQNRISGLAYRLQQGDIWPGDVIDLSVNAEPKWVGEFSVTPSRHLELDDIDPQPLDGVLYSEVEETITLHLARYLREPRVRVDVLKRIGVLGDVGSPGFYNVSGSNLVSDVIMLAGGPGGSANIDKAQFRRLGERVAEGRPRVAWQSLSLDQLGVISGDELYIPSQGPPWTAVIMGLLGVAVSLTFIFVRI
jgi:protein involved in polysaccharide export with SLBB domain